MSVKERAASLLSRTGFLRALEQLPTEPGVIVFNHHRIGDRNACPYDRQLYSATAEQFESQVEYIKRRFPILLPRELAEMIARKKQLTRMHAMITFDDGYLDNYTVAYEVLRRHQVPATFYLVSDFVGTGYMPWWDQIAYLIRYSPKTSLELSYCDERPLLLEPDREAAIQTVVSAYKSDLNQDSAAFLKELQEQAGVPLPASERRFLNWDEAREMAAGGMEIGAHTQTHPIISRLSSEDQRRELRSSKATLEQHLGQPVESLAYPNGSPKDFTPETLRHVQEAGYTTAFSFYGGINRQYWTEPYNLLRVSPDPRPGSFRLDAVLGSRFGHVEPALRKSYQRLRPRT